MGPTVNGIKDFLQTPTGHLLWSCERRLGFTASGTPDFDLLRKDLPISIINQFKLMLVMNTVVSTPNSVLMTQPEVFANDMLVYYLRDSW